MFRVCMRVEAIIPVHGPFVTSILDYFGGDVADRAGDKGELLVGKAEEFCSVKR